MSSNDNFGHYGLIDTPEQETQFSHTRWGASVQGSLRTTRPYVYEIVHYKAVHSPYHEFIVAGLRHPLHSNWRGSLRLERFVRFDQEGARGDRIGSKAARVLSPQSFVVGLPAEDMVTVCKPGTIHDPPTLPSTTEAVVISTLSMPNDQISDVQLSILVDVLHAEQPSYDAFKSQCYWYAAAIYDAVRVLCSGSTVKGHYFHLGGKHASPGRFKLLSLFAFLSVNESSIKIRLPTNVVREKYAEQFERFQEEQVRRIILYCLYEICRPSSFHRRREFAWRRRRSRQF